MTPTVVIVTTSHGVLFNFSSAKATAWFSNRLPERPACGHTGIF
jgi:hypothetical protein